MDYCSKILNLLLFIVNFTFNYLTITTFAHPCCKVEIPDIRNEGTGFIYDCSNCGLAEIPQYIPNNTSTLRLRNSKLASIPSNSFSHLVKLTILDLFDNPIQKFENNSFNGLHFLEYLDLRRTEYHLQKPLPHDLFLPLNNLLTLKLDNIFPGDIMGIPDTLFSSLNKLTFLQLAVPESFSFGQEFKSLTNLETLVIFGWNCNLGIINKETFRIFQNTSLKVVEVRDCNVAHIEPDSFIHFLHLHTLNLACNKDGSIANFFDAVKSVPSGKLHTLILDGCRRSEMFTSFDSNLVNGKAFQQLTRLSLRSTTILKIDPDVFLEMPNLEHITFGFNMLLFFPDGEYYNRTAHIINQGRLKMIDISHFGESFGGHNNFRNHYCRDADRYSDDFFRKLPSYITVPEFDHRLQKEIKEINYTQFGDPEKFLFDNLPSSLYGIFANSLASRNAKLNGIHMSTDNNIVYMDFSLVPIKWVAKPLIGLTKLQGLDLSSCRIETIIPDAFSYLPSLQYLNLTRNYLKNTDLNQLLSNVTSLKWLDISFNDLEIIHNDTFSEMTNLTSLILKGNHLNNINFNLTSNSKLEFLDLSLCALPYLDKHFIQQLETIQIYNIREFNEPLKMDLSGNVFECECSAIEFIEWLNNTRVQIQNKHSLECRYKDVNSTILSIDTTELKRRCSGWPSNEALATIAVGVTTLAVSAVYLALAYRWTLRWYYYLARRNIVNFLKRFSRQNQEESVEYKVFISYDPDTQPHYDWVENVLYTKINDDWNMPVCLTRAHFDAGLDYLEILHQAVAMSQFTIIVITEKYEDSCFVEMRMAIEKGVKHIIIINLEQASNMSDTLRGLLTIVKCLEYVEECLDKFWKQLHEILNTNE